MDNSEVKIFNLMILNIHHYGQTKSHYMCSRAEAKPGLYFRLTVWLQGDHLFAQTLLWFAVGSSPYMMESVGISKLSVFFGQSPPGIL